MPIANFNLPEQGGLYYRMVVDSVMKDVLVQLGLPNDTVFSWHSDDEEVAKNANAPLDILFKKAGFTSHTKLVITYDRYFPSETRMTNRLQRQGTPVVFLDPDLNFFIKPVYRYCVCQINLSVRFKSRGEARQWLRTAERRLNSKTVNSYHELKYHYPLPNQASRFICEVYDRRYSWLPVEQRPETLKQYVERCMTPRSTAIVNQAGKHATTVINERMTRVIGMPTYTDADLNEAAPDPIGTHSITLQYQFEHDCVDGVSVGFPYMVHNQLMPDDILQHFIEKPISPWQRLELKSIPRYNLDVAGDNTTEGKEINYPNSTLRRAIQPFWDDFQPKYINPNQNIVLSTLLLMDTSGASNLSLLNLESLGEWSFYDSAIEYMKGTYDTLTKIGYNVIHINVYKDKTPYWKNPLIIDDELNVSFTHEPDLAHEYRLVVNIQFDIAMLPPEELERLRHYPEFVYALLNLLYRGKDAITLREELTGEINKDDFNNFIKIIGNQRYKPPRPIGGIWPLTAISSIVTHSI